MLKRVLCLIIIAMTIITTSVVGVGAVTSDVAETNKKTKTLMIGDVDFNGKISITDATEIQRWIADIIILSDEQLYIAKTISSDHVSIIDVTEIQRFLAGYRCSGHTGEIVEIDVPDDSDNGIDFDAIEKAVEERFMEYINEERKAVGVQYLNTNDTLMRASKIRGDELVVLFSHTRPDGTMCFSAVDNQLEFLSLGENIAYNAGYVDFSDSETIEYQIDFLAWKFYDQFKNSPGHYENMIRDNFNCHGAGVTIFVDEEDGTTNCFIAHMFGET